MRVALPALAGSYGLEWLVKPGDRVEQGQVLAWLAVVDHCALVPLNAPTSGVITSRWSDLLSSGRAGAVVAAIDGDDDLCHAAQRRALEQERLVVFERLQRIETQAKHPAAPALLEQERHRLSCWLSDCDALLTR